MNGTDDADCAEGIEQDWPHFDCPECPAAGARVFDDDGREVNQVGPAFVDPERGKPTPVIIGVSGP